MDAIRGWTSKIGTKAQETIVIGAISLVTIAFSMKQLGLARLLSAIYGRLRLKRLSYSLKADKEKDATLTNIFIYPGMYTSFLRRCGLANTAQYS